ARPPGSSGKGAARRMIRSNVLELEKKGEVLSRLRYAPQEKMSPQRLARLGGQPEIALLPMARRPGRLRVAALLGPQGRYQLQLLAETLASYTLTMRDPSIPIAWDKAVDGVLPVGGAAFFTFKAAPGQLLQARLTAQQFVPMLRLYDQRGNLVASSGDDGDG